MLKTNRVHVCPKSPVGSTINGQPPSITLMACFRPNSVADRETLAVPVDRCIQTRLIPSWAHWAMVASAASGLVPITTASTPPVIDFRSGQARSPSAVCAFGLTAKSL